MKKLVDGDLSKRNEEFIREVLKEEPNLFNQLKQGQAPDFFVLACCDSRVSPSVVTNMPLGHMFVHRNIGNQVSEKDESFTASLYHALKNLGVKKIIVKGHTECGGVAAAWADQNDPEMEPWIDEIRSGLPDKHEHPDATMDDLVKANVMEQIERLEHHPIFKKYGQDVDIYGCLYHIDTGKLERIQQVERSSLT